MSDADRRAWVAAVRSEARSLHNAALATCLVGVLVMVGGAFMHGAPGWVRFAGLLVILCGWALFGVAIWRRMAYMRAHPFASRPAPTPPAASRD
ncbi:MAG TPA: hypothetical protein VG248_16370 [Caulobacteraceae bacterium]|jgi:hypothetical protein|nr:hypothetical protein [Caulobacteraceae bacterium]